MKQKTLITRLLLLFVLGAAVFLTACNQNNFNGTRVANPDSYRLDIEQMTGTDAHTLELEACDTLEIHFETERGKLHMEIKAPDGTLIYTGNGEETTDFTVNISENGEYSIHVEAYKARGTVSIQRIALQEEKK